MPSLPADEIYAFIDNYESSNIVEFARTALGLTGADINAIVYNNPYNRRAQIYDFIVRWAFKNPNATIMTLMEKKKRFLTGTLQSGGDEEDQPRTVNPSHPSSEFQQRVVEMGSGDASAPQCHELSYRNRSTDMNCADVREEQSRRLNAIYSSLKHPETNVESRDNTSTSSQEHEISYGNRIPAPEEQPSHSENSEVICGQGSNTVTTSQDSETRLEGDSGARRAVDGEESDGPTCSKGCRERTEQSKISYCDAVEEKLSVNFCTDKEIYDINAKSKKNEAYKDLQGYVLIVNNNFKNSADKRKGAKIDVENMKNLWRLLGYYVVVIEDVTAYEIRAMFQYLALEVKFYNFLVVFIMSHGTGLNGDDIVYGNDSGAVYIKEVLEFFDNKSCPRLRGRPKLFFLQACRGKNIGEVVYGDNRTHELEIDSLEIDSSLKLPKMADFMISYATQFGDVALRSETGSWFINAIANVFAEFAHKEHVEEMMIKVRKAVMEKTGQCEIPESPGKYVYCKETSETRTLLTKKLFLKPIE